MALTLSQPPAPATAGGSPELVDLPDPAICPVCNGEGTVETVSYAVGMHDVRCPGPLGEYECDGGFLR